MGLPREKSFSSSLLLQHMAPATSLRFSWPVGSSLSLVCPFVGPTEIFLPLSLHLLNCIFFFRFLYFKISKRIYSNYSKFFDLLHVIMFVVSNQTISNFLISSLDRKLSNNWKVTVSWKPFVCEKLDSVKNSCIQTFSRDILFWVRDMKMKLNPCLKIWNQCKIKNGQWDWQKCFWLQMPLMS